jgi:uncharacterized protein (DUF2141 family)
VIGASTATPTAVFVANTLVTVSTLTLSADTLAPANPYGLTATNAGFGTVFLNWFMPTTNANGSSLIDFATFKLQRSTSSVGPFTTVVTSTSTNFTDANAVVGVSNYYRVVAVDYAGNNSAPSAIIVIQPASGGTISGNLKYTGTATQGVFRVRLSSAVAGTTLAETTLDPFSFTGLYDGVYYVRVFRDLNGDSVHQDGEPGGTIGGIAQPYPINIVSASAFAGSTVPVCDRTSAIFPAAGSAQSYAISISSAGCPALDQGQGFFTNLLSFRVGGGSAGSVGVGASISIQMQSNFSNRLLLLGPDGNVQAQDSRTSGSVINLSVNQPGLYLIEPTSFNPYETGTATVTVSLTGGFAGVIAGSVAYNGSQSGRIFVQLFSSPASNSLLLAQSTMSTTGAFSLSGLPDSLYYIRSFRDTNGNFSQDPGEAMGVFGLSASSLTAVQIQGGVTSVAGVSTAPITLTLTDPAVGNISGQIIRQGTQSGTIRVDVSVPEVGCSSCDARVVAFTTMSNAGTYSVNFLSPATNYILTSYVDVNSNAKADPLEAQASTRPITVAANQNTSVSLVVNDPGSGSSGNAAIQGTITYGGTSTGSLLMAFATDAQFQSIGYTLSQAGTGTYVKSGVLENTSYYVLAFLDSNNNGQPELEKGEAMGFYGASPSNDPSTAFPIYVATGAATANIVLADPPSGAIYGQVTYRGTQFIGSQIVVRAYIADNDRETQSAVIPAISSGVAYAYTLSFLKAASNWNVLAFIDVNENTRQDFGEPTEFFGQTSCSATTSCTGQSVFVSRERELSPLTASI